MTLEIEIPDSMGVSARELREFRAFLQSMTNRLAVGEQRYGKPNYRKAFMTKLGKELAAYRSAGNFEQLLNVAVYAFLESYAPENRKLHWDAAVDSVTRQAAA